MASHCLVALILLNVCFVCVQCDSVEDAKTRGFVKIITLQRSKLTEPIVITRGIPNKLSMEIFCYEGVNSVMVERLWRVFCTGKLHIKTKASDYQLFSGANESAVYSAYTEVRQTWVAWRNMFPWQSQSVSIAPFNKTCIGVTTAHPYTVMFIRNYIDVWLLLIFICGVVLFFSADRLSRNVLFYYGTGVTVGVLASLIILVLILHRFIPWQKAAYAFFLGGSALISWGYVQLLSNIADLAQHHYHYLLGYMICVGLVSFAMCYYKGPVRDPRTLNLIKWTVQLVALVAVFLSMQVEEAAAAVILIMISIYNFPQGLLICWQKAFRRRFPRKRRLLTQAEYQMQADANTRQALEELREYCLSPNCDAWRTISRLDTPQRRAHPLKNSVPDIISVNNYITFISFAKWVEGSSHVTEDELDLYDSEPSIAPEVTDDEDEIDFRLNSL